MMYLTLGGQAFTGCSLLSQIIFISGLSQIGPGVQIFQETALTSLTLPSSLTAIGNYSN